MEVTTLDEAVREETRRSQWQQLAHEHRRLCITGFRLTTSRGQMAEGRIGATPTRVMMLETLAGIVRRRHYNANLAHDATPNARVDSIFKDARAALVRQFYYTAKRAQQTEREIRLRIPGWQPSPGEGPVAEWERDWLASGFFSDDGQCARFRRGFSLPATLLRMIAQATRWHYSASSLAIGVVLAVLKCG